MSTRDHTMLQTRPGGRLRALRREDEEAQRMMADVRPRHAALRETLPRISGASQVLEAMMEREEEGDAPGARRAREASRVEELAPANGATDHEPEVSR